MREANMLLARWQANRGMASESGPYDAVIIGGGAQYDLMGKRAQGDVFARSGWLRRGHQGCSARSQGAWRSIIGLEDSS